MRRFVLAGLLVAAASLQVAAQEEKQPRALDRIQDIGDELRRCWLPPPQSGGLEITVMMSFKRNGELLGKPRITFSKLAGDAETQKTFVASVFRAIERCTPLHLTDALGGAIAGRPITMHYSGRNPERQI